jgi:hypothetical protein
MHCSKQHTPPRSIKARPPRPEVRESTDIANPLQAESMQHFARHSGCTAGTINRSVTTDGRHLRARWIIYSAGLLLWAVTLPMPLFPGSAERILSIYPESYRAATKLQMSLSNTQEIIDAAALLGFIIATGVLIISPLLMSINHSERPMVRRWRSIAFGLLAMAQVSVMLLASLRLVPSHISWSGHLLVLSHLIVCIAIIPWPRETAFAQSGFDVIIPDPKPTNTNVTTDAHR